MTTVAAVPDAAVRVAIWAGSGSTGAPSEVAAASSAALNSSAVWNRFAGSFSRQRSAIAASSGEICRSGRLSAGGIGASVICFTRTAGVDGSLKGTSPTSISYRMIPSE
jgi:hypothetical protein